MNLLVIPGNARLARFVSHVNPPAIQTSARHVNLVTHAKFAIRLNAVLACLAFHAKPPVTQGNVQHVKLAFLLVRLVSQISAPPAKLLAIPGNADLAKPHAILGNAPRASNVLRDKHKGGIMEGCKNCFTCQSGVRPDITAEKIKALNGAAMPQDWLTAQGQGQAGCRGNGPAPFPITYFVFLTNDCNLRCSYCYAEKTPVSMDSQLVRKTVDFIMKAEPKRIPNRQLSIQFFGGEPTVAWANLEIFVNLVETEKQPVQWGMTTNGTNLNERRLCWLKQHGFKLLLSIDGPKEIHDRHRKTVGGKGSFELIPFDLIKKYYPNSEIRPTVMPDTVEFFPDTVRWFYSHEFFMIATEVAYEAEWSDKDFEKARRAYEELGDMYITRSRANLPMWMKFINDVKNALGTREQRGPVCGIGKNSIGIDAHGLLYNCQRYAAMNDTALSIGHVEKGLDLLKLTQAQALCREDMYPDFEAGFFCAECPARFSCQGGCNAMNYQNNDDRRRILKNYCRFQRLWVEIALRVLSATGELWERR